MLPFITLHGTDWWLDPKSDLDYYKEYIILVCRGSPSVVDGVSPDVLTPSPGNGSAMPHSPTPVASPFAAQPPMY